jgi:hypothetical protein
MKGGASTPRHRRAQRCAGTFHEARLAPRLAAGRERHACLAGPPAEGVSQRLAQRPRERHLAIVAALGSVDHAERDRLPDAQHVRDPRRKRADRGSFASAARRGARAGGRADARATARRRGSGSPAPPRASRGSSSTPSAAAASRSARAGTRPRHRSGGPPSEARSGSDAGAAGSCPPGPARARRRHRSEPVNVDETRLGRN